MLGSGKTGRFRGHTANTAASDHDTDIYLRYAVGLYRQALFNGDRSTMRAVLRRQATPPAAGAEDVNPVSGAAAGGS
jgi:hypothetical protein